MRLLIIALVVLSLMSAGVVVTSVFLIGPPPVNYGENESKLRRHIADIRAEAAPPPDLVSYADNLAAFLDGKVQGPYIGKKERAAFWKWEQARGPHAH